MVYLIILLISFVKSGHSITSKVNSAQLLWNLTGIAIQSRRFPSYTENFQPNYPNQHNFENGNILPNPESFLEALDSIAQHDDLQCVPRLLCEITSGTLTAKQSTFLPFNVDTDSLLGFLSSFGQTQSSPILLFGKAALLGYTRRGNINACLYQYPQCPRDSNRLLDYLNNYNGGFFRFFKGINPLKQNLFNANGLYTNDPFQKSYPEQRILNKFALFENDVRFPNDDRIEYIRNYRNERSGKRLKFPNGDDTDLDFQKPLPNHKIVPVFFPDRTGTGELLIDTEKNIPQYDIDKIPNLINFEH